MKTLLSDEGFEKEMGKYGETVPPAGFELALLGRLEVEQKMKIRGKRWKGMGWAGGGMAVAAAVALAVWVTWPGGTKPEGVPERWAWNDGGVNRITDNPSRARTQDLEVNYSTTTFADDVAQSQLIVLVRIDDFQDMTADCSVLRVLYGRSEEKKLRVDMTWGQEEIRKGYEEDARRWFQRENERQPSAAELLATMQYLHSLKKGREGILMLAPAKDERGLASTAQGQAGVKGATTGYRALRIDFMEPAPLAAFGKQIAKEIREGNYLKPNPFFHNEFFLDPKVARAQAIFRATLVENGEVQATWHITKVLKGNVPAEIIISHDGFQQRAEALATLASLEDASLMEPAAFAARVKKEKEILLQAELPAGQEALLFVENMRTRLVEGTQGPATIASMYCREFPFQKSGNLARTEKLVQDSILKIPSIAAAPNPLGRGRASSAAPTPKDQQALESTLIVRARITGWRGQEIEYAVTRIIYGDLDEKVLRINFIEVGTIDSLLTASREGFKASHGRDPGDEELYARFMEDHSVVKGREVILLLKPVPEVLRSMVKPVPGQTVPYMKVAMFRDNPPTWPLDPVEAEFVQVVKDGSFLEPLPNGRGMEPTAEDRALWLQWYQAETVVRATVVQVTETGTRWRIEKTLKGKIETSEVVVGHETFQRRAEAVARYEALKDVTWNDAVTYPERVKQEKERMILAELAPKREAILFLGNLKREGEYTLANMQARVYDNSKRVVLGDIEAAIASQGVVATTDAVPAPTTPERRGRSEITLGTLSLEDQISRVPLIVRMKFEDCRDLVVECTVERAIYGKTDLKTWRMDLAHGSAQVKKSFESAARTRFLEEQKREPTAEELMKQVQKDHGYEKGRNAILLLEPWDGGYRMMGARYDAPPEHGIDQAEAQIVEAIEKGTYLEPRPIPGDVFLPKVQEAEMIVRGKVVEVTDAGARWQVIKTLKEKKEPIQPTVDHERLVAAGFVLVDHESFRKRAEAIAAHAALKDEQLKDKPRHEAAVKAKMEEMIKQELKVGTEGILFLGKVKQDGKETHATLLHRMYEDAKGERLRVLEEAVKNPKNAEIRL